MPVAKKEWQVQGQALTNDRHEEHTKVLPNQRPGAPIYDGLTGFQVNAILERPYW
jgi:hypothetical protein